MACRLYAYEGVGVLLGQEELPAQEQHAYIAALLQPLIHQVCMMVDFRLPLRLACFLDATLAV